MTADKGIADDVRQLSANCNPRGKGSREDEFPMFQNSRLKLVGTIKFSTNSSVSKQAKNTVVAPGIYGSINPSLYLLS